SYPAAARSPPAALEPPPERPYRAGRGGGVIGRAALNDRVREWGLREDVVEKDYVLGWLLWGIGSEPAVPPTSLNACGVASTSDGRGATRRSGRTKLRAVGPALGAAAISSTPVGDAR